MSSIRSRSPASGSSPLPLSFAQSSSATRSPRSCTGSDRLTEMLVLDRERARRWALGQTSAWCFDEEYHPDHVETARWLLGA